MKQKRLEEQKRAELLYLHRVKEAERISVNYTFTIQEERKLKEKKESKERCKSYKMREEENNRRYGSYVQRLKVEYEIVQQKLKDFNERMHKCLTFY